MDKIRVLDLFSGTGSISYEFFSRGCEYVTAVEISSKHYRFISKIISELKAEKNILLYKADAFKFVKNTPLNYDIIFADPPYDLANVIDLPTIIFSNENLKPDALIIIEHSQDVNFSKSDFFFNQRNYGKVNFSFLKRK